MSDLRPPVVTDADRAAALADRPADWDVSGPLLAKRGPPLEWEHHVAEQIERFERHYAYDRKPAAEWSGLWRRSWWPNADPFVLHPHTNPQAPPDDRYVVIRRADATWPRVLALLSPSERRLSERIGVVQLRASDDRARQVAA